MLCFGAFSVFTSGLEKLTPCLQSELFQLLHKVSNWLAHHRLINSNSSSRHYQRRLKQLLLFRPNSSWLTQILFTFHWDAKMHWKWWASSVFSQTKVHRNKGRTLLLFMFSPYPSKNMLDCLQVLTVFYITQPSKKEIIGGD